MLPVWSPAPCGVLPPLGNTLSSQRLLSPALLASPHLDNNTPYYLNQAVVSIKYLRSSQWLPIVLKIKNLAFQSSPLASDLISVTLPTLHAPFPNGPPRVRELPFPHLRKQSKSESLLSLTLMCHRRSTGKSHWGHFQIHIPQIRLLQVTTLSTP